MYVLEYRNKPENGELHPSGREFDDFFPEEISKNFAGFDRYIYFVDMFKIIEDCSKDFLSIDVNDKIEFWRMNKYLLNYVNAVYSLKEYINSYAPPLKAVTETYYRAEHWYRFICDFRNRVIHQSVIIKDCMRKSGDIFINLDELIKVQSRVVEESTIKHKKNEERFKANLEKLIPTAVLIDGRHYLSMKSIIQSADKEIDSMKSEVLKYAYDKGVKSNLAWLLSLVHWENEFEQYTFIVNKQTGDVFEPNFALEWYCLHMLEALGSSHDICKTILSTLSEKGYDFFFKGMKPTSEIFNQ